MKILCVALTLLASVSCVAQSANMSPQAQVTSYTIGMLRSNLPGYSRESFTGHIFDNDRQLALMLPGRFITFNLNLGTHVFSPHGLTSKRQGGPRLSLDLVANQHYFIGVYLKNSYIVIPKITFEQVSCKDAKKDAHNPKPLEEKHIEQGSVTLALSETSFPQCP